MSGNSFTTGHGASVEFQEVDGASVKKYVDDLIINSVVSDFVPDDRLYVFSRQAMDRLKMFSMSIKDVKWETMNLPTGICSLLSPMAVYDHRWCFREHSISPSYTKSVNRGVLPFRETKEYRPDPVYVALARKDEEHRRQVDADLAKIPIARPRLD